MTKQEKIESYIKDKNVIQSELFKMVLDSASDIMFSSRSIEEFTLRSSKTPGIENVPEFLDKINRLSDANGDNVEFVITTWGTINEPGVSVSMYTTDDSTRVFEDQSNFDFDQVKVKINRYRQVSKLLDL